ncbi:MAG: DUF1003 domain-containing protein [Bryobacteraceae bacterium]
MRRRRNPKPLGGPMACDAELLTNVPLFSLLDADERAVLASHVEVRTYAPNERIYRAGDAGGAGYVVIGGSVRVTLIDEDNQEVTVDQPDHGGFFGFASLLDGTPHQTNARALTAASCLEIDREDLLHLLRRRPEAGMDMLAVIGRQFHAAQRLVQARAMRNPNEVIEESATTGERIADAVARFGGSWSFIILFAVVLAIYTAANVVLGNRAWDPYPFILLNLFLSMLAAIQAPVIMMSQNRQDAKDRVRSESDFQIDRKAESELRALTGRVIELQETVAGIESSVRHLRGNGA